MSHPHQTPILIFDIAVILSGPYIARVLNRVKWAIAVQAMGGVRMMLQVRRREFLAAISLTAATQVAAQERSRVGAPRRLQ